MLAALRSWLLKVLGVAPEDSAGLPLSASAAFALLAAYYLVQPLSDAMALHVGVENTPLITVGNLILIAICNPLYACLVKALPLATFIAVVYRILGAVLVAFGVGFFFVPDSPAISFGFAIYIGTFSLFLMSTFWARMASLHTKDQTKRVYGVIAAGAQTGQLLSSVCAAFLFSAIHESVVFVSVAFLELAVCLIGRRSLVGAPVAADEPATAPGPSPAAGVARLVDGLTGGLAGLFTAPCAGVRRPPANSEDRAPMLGDAMGRPKSDDPAPDARGDDRGGCACAGDACDSALGGARLLLSTPLLRAVSLHTLLITFIVSGVWYERAAAVSVAFATDEARYAFFSRLNAAVGLVTLFVQLVLFSHIVKRIGVVGSLLLEPLTTAAGLAVANSYPGLASIALLDGMRKVVHYSLLKPTKESLYAALPREQQFRAKPLLDTLVYRSGSLIGAAYFEAAMRLGLSPTSRRYLLLGATLAWALNSYVLGRIAEESRPS